MISSDERSEKVLEKPKRWSNLEKAMIKVHFVVIT